MSIAVQQHQQQQQQQQQQQGVMLGKWCNLRISAQSWRRYIRGEHMCKRVLLDTAWGECGMGTALKQAVLRCQQQQQQQQQQRKRKRRNSHIWQP
jgi:hypothetical protein